MAAPIASDGPVDAYHGSVAALMWPGATRAFQVTSAGELFNGAWFVRIEPSSEGALADPPERIACEGGWCPVVHWTRTDGGLRWDFEAVAFPEDEPAPWSARGEFARLATAREREADGAVEAASFAGVPQQRLARLLLGVRHPLERSPIDRRNLFVSLLVTVRNTGSNVAEARLAMRCEPPGSDPPYLDSDPDVRTPWGHCWRGREATDSLLGFSGLSQGEVSGRQSSQRWRLAPGERATLHAILPVYPTPGRTLASIERVPHARRAQRAREYWQRETARGAAFEIPDSALCDAIRAARVVLLSCRERRDLDWVPIGGPFHYRDIWIRDGARVAEALAVSGYTRESREFAHAFLRFQTANGSFVSQKGQLDGTGQALWAFEQTLLRPAPAPRLHEYAAAAERAWQSLQMQRGLSRGQGVVAGMLPETNPYDGELVRAQLVGNDAWALVGYRATQRLLAADGAADAADRVDRSRLEYLDAFRRAAESSGRADLPPSWQGVGLDWGNLNAGYPCEVLEPSDTRLEALARRYWKPVSGPGLGYYRNPDTLHTYVAADLGTVALRAGDRIAADRILDAMLRWRTPSGGAAECFTASTRDFGRNFPPHATAAAALVSLVRNALVFDDGERLELALGARASWWTGTVVRDAPTRWGRIDLHIARDRDAVAWNWTAVPVWTVLTLPPRTRPASIDAPLRAGPRPDQVLAPPGATRARVRVVAEASS
jgi:hypothetical protein